MSKKYRKKEKFELVGMEPDGYIVQSEGKSDEKRLIGPDYFYENYEEVVETHFTDVERVQLLLSFLDRLTELNRATVVPEQIYKSVVNELNKELNIRK